MKDGGLVMMVLLKKALRFLNNERGSGSVFMIILLPVFLTLAGLAIDASSAYRARAILQGAADAAALAAALDVPDHAANAAADAANYAHLNLPVSVNGDILLSSDVETGNWNVDTHTFTEGGTPMNAVRVVTKKAVSNGNPLPTTFLSLIGIKHWDVAAQAIATTSQPKLWVALVLDNTGSMCEPDRNPCPTDTNPNIKINALKTAANNLLTTLQGAASTPGDVMVSIVPFTRDVNIGTGYAGSSWLSTTPPTPANTVGPGSACPWTDAATGYHCQTSPTSTTSVTKIPSSGTYKGYICPSSSSIGDYYEGCFNSVAVTKGKTTTYNHTWIANSGTSWAGCITDRNQNYDTMDTTPTTSSVATLFPVDNTPSSSSVATCPAQLMPLTDNWTTLSTKINSMTASGSTNQTIGLVWGWQSMTQGNPLNAPALPKGTQRYIILLSDGLNTQDRWYGDGANHNTSVDARMEAACDNAKADGITIFTVYVDLYGTTGSSATLQYCASDPTKDYFDLTTPGEIITAFDTIGRQIAPLRLVD